MIGFLAVRRSRGAECLSRPFHPKMAAVIRGSICLVLAAALLPCALFAEDSESFWTRDTLTGDWGGGRTWLADHGVGVQFEFTEYYQGMFGGTGDKSSNRWARPTGS